jgi:hypothetical protein
MASPVPLRSAGETPGAGRGHAVINALIEELPAPGAPWPAAERKAWLELMATAFTLAYGKSEGHAMRQSVADGGASQPVRARKPRPPKPVKITAAAAGFHVDRDGFARDHKGDRILPDDVAGPLVDLRGEHGNLSQIRWADDTFGIPRGMNINVTIAPV